MQVKYFTITYSRVHEYGKVRAASTGGRESAADEVLDAPSLGTLSMFIAGRGGNREERPIGLDQA